MSAQFLTSPLLAAAPGIRHAFFTRRGGVSLGLYESLNTGFGSGDETSRVAENRRRTAATFDLGETALNTAHQVHSAICVHASAPWGAARPTADAMVSSTAGVICAALAADCAPVLIADSEARVVAAVHAGWRGALEGVVGSAIAAMTALGAQPGRMVAAIGPCIARDSYEVGEDFLGHFEARCDDAGKFFSPGAMPSKRQFDLPAFVTARLAAHGVDCEWIGRDTVSEEGEFFSNRRALLRGEADYGRLLSAIVLDQS
jgi:YfiH family protein